VNPQNVFATFRGEVKLFDFGLAKVTTGDTASAQHMLAGKLSYLSPEQVMQMPIDRRSDIFSLGTSLWEFLTGKRLFRRDTDIDTVRAVQLGPIPDVRSVAPELPEDLARIVKTALERNRDHRYPSAGYLARDLDAWLYKRVSPQDVMARLAQLVDTLFPGEQKRQGGWLKPAITSSAQRLNFNATMPSAGSDRSAKPEKPVGLEVRRDTRETTAVMANAPTHTPAEGAAAVQPGPLTPQGGVPAVPPSSQVPSIPASAAVSLPPSVSPTTPRYGSGAGGGPAMTARRGTTRMPRDTPEPMSRTEVGIPEPAKTDPPTDITAAPPVSTRSPNPQEIDVERTIVNPDGSFPPPPKTPSLPPSRPTPSVPPPQKRASIPPPSMKPPPSPSMAPKPGASIPPRASPSISPKPTPATPMRPSRAPIPLPSSKKSAIPLPSKSGAHKPHNPSVVPAAPTPAPAPAPRKRDTNPPDSSKTQIDVPLPDRKR
jgi:serine/threonine-protein kinase